MADPTTQKNIVAYLPGYATNAKRNYSIDDAPGFVTHLIYGFAGLQDNGVNPATATTPETKGPCEKLCQARGLPSKVSNNKAHDIHRWLESLPY